MNAGVDGNRLLRTYGSEAALTRFDRDVLSVADARWVVVLLGTNDIIDGGPNLGAFFGGPFPVTTQDLIFAHRQLITRAHARGLKIFGATVTPYEGGLSGMAYYPEGETMRTQLNEWIRNGGEYDGVIDFDAAVRDPAAPTKLLADYASSDLLHPNDAGYRAMADAIDLTLFR